MWTPVKKNPQLSPRTDLSGTKSIQGGSPCFPHLATKRLPKYTVEILGRDFKFGHHAIDGSHIIMTSLVLTFSAGFLKFLFRLSQAKKILEVYQLLTTILNSTVSMMLLLMKQQNQKPQRVKLKQK